MKILLHVCCGPCLIGLGDFLKGHEVVLYFYNPNIEPFEEYEKRLDSVRKVASKFGLELIEGNYENDFWHSKVKGLEKEPEGGKRCRVCFAMRLEKTAEVALENQFDSLGTTLSVNAWKDIDFINTIGKEVAKSFGLKFFDFDLNKEEIRKICYDEKELAKEHNLYKQKYCGCLYGLQNQKQGR